MTHDVGGCRHGRASAQADQTQNVVADIIEQVFLLGDRQPQILDGDDLVDDVPAFPSSRRAPRPSGNPAAGRAPSSAFCPASCHARGTVKFNGREILFHEVLRPSQLHSQRIGMVFPYNSGACSVR